MGINAKINTAQSTDWESIHQLIPINMINLPSDLWVKINPH